MLAMRWGLARATIDGRWLWGSRPCRRVLEDDGGFPLVGHKYSGGSREDALGAVPNCGGQRDAYAETIEAAAG